MTQPDYFAVFGLPISFDIDAHTLEQQYFAVQRATHPDKQIQKTAADRTQALRQSMLANEAYDTLKSPLKRARHILALQGVTLEGKNATPPSPALLMEVMELREALEQAATAQDIAALTHENETSIQRIIQKLSQAFASSALSLATHLTLDLGYRTKFAEELRVKRKIHDSSTR